MLTYGIIVFSILLLGLFLGEWKPSRKKEIIFLCISSVILIVFSSIRATNVGIDYFQFYVPFFENVHSGGWKFLVSEANPYRKEFGFSFLTFLLSRVTGNIFVYMAFIAVIMIGLTALVLYRDCSKPWIGMFIFVSFNFFGNSLSYIRQSLAIAIFLFAIHYLKEKRFVPYLLIVLLAATFHNSLLLMIPVYFLAQIAVNWLSIGTYAGITVLVLSFSWQIFDFITQFIYKGYATENGIYFMKGRDFMTGFVPVLAMVAMIVFQKLLLKRNPKNVVLINMAMYTGIFFIFTWKHFLFQRVGNIFFTAAILYIPELLCALQLSEEEKQQHFLDGKGKWRNFGYYYGLGAVVLFGLIYYFWFIQQNRINLLPFYTVFQELMVSALRVQASIITFLNGLVETFG